MSESAKELTHGIPQSADEIEQFKKLRDLSNPTTQATAINEFAKWLFASVGTVTGLGLAFATPSVAKLADAALIMTGLAVLCLGASLSAATWVLATGLPEVNYESLSSMRQEWKRVLGAKRAYAKVAGLSFAAALVLAASAPLLSTGTFPRKNGSALGSWQFSIGKESAKLTGKIAGRVGSRVEYGAMAVGKVGSRDLFGGIGEVPESGAFEVSGVEVAIVPQDTEVQIWFRCPEGKRITYSVMLQPKETVSDGDQRAWAMPNCPSN